MLTPSVPQFRRQRGRTAKKAPAVVPPAPPAHVVIQQVLVGEQTADWVFDSDIVELIDFSPLHIKGASPDSLESLDNNIVRVHYEVAIDVGDAWSYDGSPVATFANGGTLQSGSGTTQER